MDNPNRQVSVREVREFASFSSVSITAADATHGFVTFRVAGQTYALPLENVERAVRMVAVSTVPDAAAGVLGIINIECRLAPVLDVRRIFGLPVHPYSADDRLLIMSIAGRRVCLVADEVCDVLNLKIAQETDLPLPRSPYMAGTVHHDGDVIFLLDAVHLLAMTDAGHTELPQ